MINRFQVMQAHTLLAGFLLPLALLYFVSGALYTLGIKGHIKKQSYTLQLQKPFEPNLEQLLKVTEQALHERRLPSPKGDPLLKRERGNYVLEWSGLRYRVTLKQDKHDRKARLLFRERDFLTQMMRIHRAEAGGLFKFLAIVLVIGLMTILATGIYMVQSVPRLRRPFFIAGAAGMVAFAAFVLI